MRIVILGAPGAGKRTQSALLAEKLDLAIVATGDLLKKAIEEENQWGLEAKALQDAGRVVTEDIILGLLREQLLRPDMTNGFILDGFPRNLLQALTLDELLLEIGKPLDKVLLIDIDNDHLMERLVGRRTCRSCGQLYNAYRNPPIVEGVCDVCGGRLHQRSDDNEETVSDRIHVFDHLIAPLITHYTKSDRLIRVDGNGTLEQVFENLLGVIEVARTGANLAVDIQPNIESRAGLEKKSNSESEEQTKTASEQGIEKLSQPVTKKSPPKKRAGKASKPAKKGLTKKSKTIAQKKAAVSKSATESDKQTNETRGGKKTSSKKTVGKVGSVKKRTQVAKKKKVSKKSPPKPSKGQKKSMTSGKTGTADKTTRRPAIKKGKVSASPKKTASSKKKVVKKKPLATKAKLSKKVTKKKPLHKKAQQAIAKKRPATKKKLTAKRASTTQAKKLTGKSAKKRLVKQNKSARNKALKKKSKKSL